ncbi:ScbR family autoregulator-binding transcription factor [Streptomyces sp. SID3343]|uniref:ScbR family autoregulator-binding transcription factor n=1 Tax=Streptomyces sp. SID3343 TaxID=2690260 RepID=UPI00136C9568|nr:TetR family transcriptional regulator [Streptomyces sp. SID3343]
MQDRAGTTRAQILAAAAQLFDERGYAGTSISDITERSGHTSGAIYFHFTGKENLARAVVQAHFAAWPPLVAGCAGRFAAPLEELVGLSFAVARAFRDDALVRGGARLWAERLPAVDPFPTPFVGWIETVEALLIQARGHGDLSPSVDPPKAARAIIMAFFGLHSVSEAFDGRAHIEEDLTGLWRLLLPTLQVRPAAEAALSRVRIVLGTEAETETETEAQAQAGTDTDTETDAEREPGAESKQSWPQARSTRMQPSR